MKDRLDPRQTLALAAIVVSLAGGVAHGDDKDPLTDGGTNRSITTCPGGTVCPGSGNGPGIYVSDPGSYCLWLNRSGSLRFCPESFENIPGKSGASESVRLKGRLWAAGKETEVTSSSVRVRLPDSTLTALREVKSPASSPPSRLGFVYQPQGAEGPVHAMGSLLSNLPLVFVLDHQPFPYSVELVFQEIAVPDLLRFASSSVPLLKLYRYQARYKSQYESLKNLPPPVFGFYCSQPANGVGSNNGIKLPLPLPLSVLARHRVNGATGVISKSKDSVTLACVSGAIVTCMEKWNYLPWNDAFKAPGADPTLLLGACIQAKRAAYFAHPNVKPNDFNSYTVEGTQIQIHDAWLNTKKIPEGGVEAVWDEQGAVCFNKANQRRPDLFNLEQWNGAALNNILPCPPADQAPNRITTGKVSN
jgi:hypothetical protein